MVDYTAQLVQYLQDADPKEAQNIDKLLLRESMDVIGVHPSCLPACNVLHTYAGILAGRGSSSKAVHTCRNKVKLGIWQDDTIQNFTSKA